VLGMFRRLAVSLFAEWRSRDPQRRHASMTDFQTAMDADQTRAGLRFVTSRYPAFKKRFVNTPCGGPLAFIYFLAILPDTR